MMQLGAVISAVLSIVPRLGVCAVTQAGVKWGHDGRPRDVGPGLYWYWPLVAEIELHDTSSQSLLLDSQYLVTADGRTITCSATLTYRITDAAIASVSTPDIDDYISEVGQRSVAELVSAASLASLTSGRRSCQQSLRRRVRRLLKPFGVTVDTAFFSTLAPARVLVVAGVQSPA